MKHMRSPVGVGGIMKGTDEWTVIDVGGRIREACCGFARAVDWQQSRHVVTSCGEHGLEVRGADYFLSESHEGLHSGNYIALSILPSADTLDIKGGYYDSYCQAKTIYRGSLALRGVTVDKLGRMLIEIYNRLDGRARSGR